MTTAADQLRAALAKPKRHKYGAKRTQVDSIWFASAHEARAYSTLKLRERAGEITDLVLQPSYDLVVNGVSVGRYVADFAFTEDGQRVTLDAKGVQTETFKLKRKIVKAIYGIDIRLL